MNYRIYIDKGKGYELKGTYTSESKILKFLDDIAMYGDMPRIMIIRHDIAQNMDEVWFRTPQFLEDYFEWRESVEQYNAPRKGKRR